VCVRLGYWSPDCKALLIDPRFVLRGPDSVGGKLMASTIAPPFRRRFNHAYSAGVFSRYRDYAFYF